MLTLTHLPASFFRRFTVMILFAGLLLSKAVNAQEKLYPNMFPVKDITLLEGPFKHARDLNIQNLLKYDTNRLLAPYLKEAGLAAKDSSYKNWEGLDGHMGGHYLTAMAINAATGNEDCQRRMEYMLRELKACQEANGKNHPSWGIGYVGGVPNSERIWSTFKKGDFKAYRAAWVPWYNVHKMYAGLRDAWLYGGSSEARSIFLKFCDWALELTSALSEEQMQEMLNVEHGGMNETLADAYQMTGDERYLAAAKRFSHQQLLAPLAKSEDDLDNKHANTQVPKAIGFQRIGELGHDERYLKAGSFFWETVTRNRSLAFGGNSRREFFPSAAASSDFINDVEGPESCNTYNMLKLTEGLFRGQQNEKYINFYERALYNHILSTQHPGHGGYVYFTPVRPEHYRVYSAPNEAMWCCVGSGMENHGKYNEFIYTHQHDSLYVNLFIASQLRWKEKGIELEQRTAFPEEEATKLLITKGSERFTLMLRYPSWVAAGALEVTINGKVMDVDTAPSSFVAITRRWKKGDELMVRLPMKTHVERMPNVPEYAAILHGPIVLGAKTGSEDLRGLVADDSRWGHIAHGKKLPLDKAPIIIEDDVSEIAQKLVPVDGEPLHFKFANERIINKQPLVLEPFYKIHDSRYMMYWMMLSSQQYVSYLDSVSALEKMKLELQARTVDFVAPGEQQPEADHAMQKADSRSGAFHDEFWRDANKDGYFSYLMSTEGEEKLSLFVRYWGAEWGNRKFDIYIDDKKLTTVDNTNRWNRSSFQNEEYPIPHELLKGKKSVRVKFQALAGNTAGPVYYIRLLKPNNVQ